MRPAKIVQLQDGTEIPLEDVECPHCLAPLLVDITDDLEGCPNLLEGDAEVECPVCGREFVLVYDYTPHFGAKRIKEGGDDGGH